MPDDVLDALHLQLGVLGEETDGDELGAGWTLTRFGALRCRCVVVNRGEKRWSRLDACNVRFFTLGGGCSSGTGESEDEEEEEAQASIERSLARFLPLCHLEKRKDEDRFLKNETHVGVEGISMLERAIFSGLS